MPSLQDIKEYISSHRSNEYNKKQKGEVFTPYVIIEKMLDELDKQYSLIYNKSVFSNKDLKWFDNSSGTGNFILVVYHRLYYGLKDVITDSDTRKKHIIENMLYSSELDKDNIDKFIKFINPKKKYKVNIHHGDSLKTNFKELFGLVNIIIGNPPYQKQNNKNNKSRGGTNNNLYMDFVKSSIDLLDKEGYLVYIHPQNWRKIGGNLSDFLRYRLEYIALNYGGGLFKGVSVNTDFYILRKVNNDNVFPTRVESYLKNKLVFSDIFHINNVDFLPKYYTNEIQSIIYKIQSKGIDKKCIVSSSCHKIRDHVHHKDDLENLDNMYPLYNTSGNPYTHFSSKKHPDQNKKKVIMSCSGNLKPIYDDGKLGTTQDSMYILVNNDDEGVKLVKVLNSKLYTFLVKICKWGNFRNEQKLFSYLKYPVISQDVNDGSIYEFFGLTDSEIHLIESSNNVK